MADEKPNPFKAMMAARSGEVAAEETPEEQPVDQSQPTTKKRSTARKQTPASEAATQSKLQEDNPKTVAQPIPESAEEAMAPVKRGRGRPPGGKRTDERWITRTYYVERNNDIGCEIELARLRAQGIELDKSDLVNMLLAAWVDYRQGGNVEKLLDEITPRQKSENSE